MESSRNVHRNFFQGSFWDTFDDFHRDSYRHSKVFFLKFIYKFSWGVQLNVLRDSSKNFFVFHHSFIGSLRVSFLNYSLSFFLLNDYLRDPFRNFFRDCFRDVFLVTFRDFSRILRSILGLFQGFLQDRENTPFEIISGIVPWFVWGYHQGIMTELLQIFLQIFSWVFISSDCWRDLL